MQMKTFIDDQRNFASAEGDEEILILEENEYMSATGIQSATTTEPIKNVNTLTLYNKQNQPIAKISESDWASGRIGGMNLRRFKLTSGMANQSAVQFKLPNGQIKTTYIYPSSCLYGMVTEDASGNIGYTLWVRGDHEETRFMAKTVTVGFATPC